MLLKGGGDGRLARSGKSGQPDCEAILFTQDAALCVGKRWVPGDVPITSVLEP